MLLTQSSQPHYVPAVLTEVSTKNLAGCKGRPSRKADNPTAICEPIGLENVGASTSHNPLGLRPVTRIALPFFIFDYDITENTLSPQEDCVV
jgi:hypothetical protein